MEYELHEDNKLVAKTIPNDGNPLNVGDTIPSVIIDEERVNLEVVEVIGGPKNILKIKRLPPSVIGPVSQSDSE